MFSRLATPFFFSILFLSAPTFAESPTDIGISQYFDSIKDQPQNLAQFLRAMPKGGDLHMHLSGATYAENLLEFSKGKDYCVNTQTYVAFEDPNCEPENLLDKAIKDSVFYNRLIDAWSMRNFQKGNESGHDHFFTAFSKFSKIAKKHRPEITSEVVNRANSQNESYLEIMDTLDNNASGFIGKDVGWDPDFDTMRHKLYTANFNQVIHLISLNIDTLEEKAQINQHCHSTPANKKCRVQVRYLYQVLREQPPEMVFAQFLAGFEAATHDKRVVGLNIVQPEDGFISMRDYQLHMQMLHYFHHLYPKVRMSLHAGELNDELVPAEGLKSHIYEAVMVAKAKRIGHGVDIAFEDNKETLLEKMASREVMVEINLSSNFIILNTPVESHPLPLYLRSNVPVTLSTDDEGVSRTDLTKEYILAVEKFNLNYVELKKLVRNSLNYSFLPGKSLWVDNSYQAFALPCRDDRVAAKTISKSCKKFLNSHEKAKIQWDLEKRFIVFEKHVREI